MEIKIKSQGKLIDATIEVVNGVLVVSPKEEKVDITKFKDGDVITCGWDDGSKSYNWTCILCGEIEYISNNMFIDDYCSLDCKGEFLDHNSGSDSATWVRYATEEEKKKLFDKMKEVGYEFDFEKKELVKLRWKPMDGQWYYVPVICNAQFKADKFEWSYDDIDTLYFDKGWVFKTKKECQQFCDKLNQSINQVKP